MTKKARKEIGENEYLLQQLSNEFVKERIRTNFEWFVSEAVSAKRLYLIFSAVTIVCPILSNVILLLPIGTNEGKIISASLMGLSAIIAAFLTLFDFRNKWGIYRNQAEEIKQLLARHAITKEETEEEILEKIEDSMRSSHRKWMKPFNSGE